MSAYKEQAIEVIIRLHKENHLDSSDCYTTLGGREKGADD